MQEMSRKTSVRKIVQRQKIARGKLCSSKNNMKTEVVQMQNKET